jgi:hypothetical protein
MNRAQTPVLVVVALALLLTACGGEGGAATTTSGVTTTTSPITTATTSTVPAPEDTSPILWVTGTTSDQMGRVLKIDGATGEVLDVLEVGVRPRQMAFGAGAMWVTDCYPSLVYRIDPETLTLEATIETRGCPSDIVVADGRVLVATTQEPGMSRIDPETNMVVDTLEFASAPINLSLGTIVVSTSAGRVYLFDAATLDGDMTLPPRATIDVGGPIRTAAVVADRLCVWLVNGDLEIYDPADLTHLQHVDMPSPDVADPNYFSPPAGAWGRGAIFGGEGQGVFFTDPNSVPVGNWLPLPSLPSGTEPGDVVAGTSQNGQVAVVTQNGGLFLTSEPVDAPDPSQMQQIDPNQVAWLTWQLPEDLTPLDVAGTSRGPDEGGYQPEACPGLSDVAPGGAIEAALSYPARVSGWGQIDPVTGLPSIWLGLLDMRQSYDATTNQFAYLPVCP